MNKIAYHSTDNNSIPCVEGTFGIGYYFSSDRNSSKQFHIGKTYRCEIDLGNSLILDQDHIMNLKKIIEDYTKETFKQIVPLKTKYLELCELEPKKFMEYLKTLGYNSISIKHPFYRYNDSVVGDTYVLFDNNFNILENYNKKDNNMKEDLTFFKDGEDKNKNGSKVKNPNRVFAAKKAHKTHGLSYKQAYKRGNDMKKDRASMVVEELEKYLESKIEQSNPVNLYAEINSDNTTMGFQIKFDENNYANVDITAVSQDKEGTGAYQLETGDADKMMASQLFQSLVNDLNTLLSNFDRDFEGVLKKNGVVRRVD